MTVRINLLPNEHRRRRARAHQLRFWVSISACVLLAQVGIAVVLGYFAQETRQARAHIATLKQQQEDLTKTLAKLTAEERSITRQHALAQRLQEKHRWSRAVAALADALPAEAMFTSVETIPFRDPGGAPGTRRVRSHRGETNTKDAEPEVTAAEGLYLVGVAESHEEIAAFLATLNSTHRLGEGQLEATHRQPFLGGEGVAFSIRTTWP